MAQRSTPQLRVVPPTLEPGPVLLHQLTELSLSSSRAVRTARYAGIRALAGAATVAVIGVTTWVAGAAPGSDVNVGPAERPTHVTTGVPSTGDDVGPPQSDGLRSAPGSPWSPGLPGAEPSVVTVAPEDAGPDEKTAAQQRIEDHSGNWNHQVKVAPDDTGDDSGDDTGHGNGHGNGHSNGPSDDATGHGNGHAYGHDDFAKRRGVEGQGQEREPWERSRQRPWPRARHGNNAGQAQQGQAQEHGQGARQAPARKGAPLAGQRHSPQLLVPDEAVRAIGTRTAAFGCTMEPAHLQDRPRPRPTPCARGYGS